MIKYRLPLLAVRDVEISKRFYHDLFDQEVALDLGKNVTFSGGFAIQQDFDELADVPQSTILHQSKIWSCILRWMILMHSSTSCMVFSMSSWCIRRRNMLGTSVWYGYRSGLAHG